MVVYEILPAKRLKPQLFGEVYSNRVLQGEGVEREGSIFLVPMHHAHPLLGWELGLATVLCQRTLVIRLGSRASLSVYYITAFQ